MVKSHVREHYERADPLTWLSIHNVLPLMTFALGFIFQSYVWGAKVEALQQKLQYYDAIVSEDRNQLNELSTVVANLSVSKADVKGSATRSAEIRQVK